jgi:hypothetical protein
MEILDDEDQGLHPAFPQQQVLEGVMGPLPSLGRIKGLPRPVFDSRSNSVRKAGRVGPRAVSSVTSLPATLSRIFHSSSRSSMWK